MVRKVVIFPTKKRLFYRSGLVRTYVYEYVSVSRLPAAEPAARADECRSGSESGSVKQRVATNVIIALDIVICILIITPIPLYR